MDIIKNAKYAMYRNLTALVGKKKPLLTDSVFMQDGRITPQEFILAGDNLTHKCSTWK